MNWTNPLHPTIPYVKRGIITTRNIIRRRNYRYSFIVSNFQFLHLLTSCLHVRSFHRSVTVAFPLVYYRSSTNMRTRRQYVGVTVSTPERSGMISSKFTGSDVRVISPAVAAHSVVLFNHPDESQSLLGHSNNENATTVKPTKTRKRKMKADVVSDISVKGEVLKTEMINPTSSPRPKRTTVMNCDNTIVSTPKATKRSSTVVVTPTNGDGSETKPLKGKGKIIKAPADWLDTYTLVKELRQDRTAPCDHSGCEALPDKNVDPITRRFQVLMCLMLSSQTKDAVVGAAIRSMQADNVLDIHSIYQMDSITLDRYIQKVGFHNNKTRYIKEVVQILIDKYNADIPRTAYEMIQDLPGIGPKMAYIIESVAWDTQSGIGVDTHMHRLFNLLHWVHPTTKTPEQTRIQLESWLPFEYWGEVNLLWVGFGQEVQQEKIKLLRKALICSRPKDALRLLQRCGLDYRKLGKELDIVDEIEAALQCNSDNNI